jgi:Protein of unknown function (DUF1592)/Protein of unknown function (DUF1588)/Protein of unknown function (DUF1595)/Protein of unknown function (DUF1585)/Protein of unknown function (DUF1587)
MRARSTWLLLSALMVASAGCTGNVSDTGMPPTGTEPTGTAPGGAATTGTPGGAGTTGSAGTTGATGAAGVATLPGSALQSQPLLRLANYEYTNTVQDLLQVQPNVQLEPDAPSTGGFRVGGPVSDNTVSVYHSAAVTLAAQVMTTLGTLESCYTKAVTTTAMQASCATSIINDLATKAYRHPVDAPTIAGLTTVYTTISGKYGFATGIQTVIEAILQSPYFLYHLETDEQAKGAGKVAVTSYDMANRLSYFIWGSMPDTTLTAAAANGTLSTPDQVAAQAQRLVADARVVPGMKNFYEQWLQVLDLPTSKSKNPVTNVDYGTMFTPAMQTSLRTSLDAQIDDALWGTGDAVQALLTGTNAWVDVNTAPLFGLTSASTTVAKTAVDPTQRAGIMTHPAIMSIFATDTASHPIKRGVFFWDKLLCQPLPDPPANVPPFVAPTPGESLRQDFETLTANVQTCQPCHARINPLGFLFEHYDTLGRYRTIDDNGQPVNSVATIVGTGDPMLDISTTDAVQFANRLGADNSKVATCMVTQVYRYAVHRREAASGADQPSLTTLSTAFDSSGRNMKTLLSSVTGSEAFLYRLNVQ